MYLITRRKKPGRHFILQSVFLKRGKVTLNLYTSLARPILKNWGYAGILKGGTDKCLRPGAKPSRKVGKFAHHRNDSKGKTLARRR
jgi:hypothetical protein